MCTGRGGAHVREAVRDDARTALLIRPSNAIGSPFRRARLALFQADERLPFPLQIIILPLTDLLQLLGGLLRRLHLLVCLGLVRPLAARRRGLLLRLRARESGPCLRG